MSPEITLVVLWIAFTATHLGLASVRIEPQLEQRMGRPAFLALYSVVALLIFVPLVTVYVQNRHAGEWFWSVPITPALRGFIQVGMGFAFVLMGLSLLRPSPASVVPGETRVSGVYRITRHPLMMGFVLLGALHLIPNGSRTDVAFFGGLTLFSLLGAWHQDRRKLVRGPSEFKDFYRETPFLPFGRRDSWRGLAELPLLPSLISLAVAAGVYWLHRVVWT